MISRTRWCGGALWLAALVLANIAILFAEVLPVKAAGITLLSAVLPGLAVAYALFPNHGELDPWERLGLGYGLGTMGVLQVVWLYALVPGRIQPLTLLLLVNFTSVLAGIAAAWRLAGAAQPALPALRLRPCRETLLGLALLAAGAGLLFSHLGYTEYDHDEVAVVSQAVTAILGNDGAVYELRKGPAQILTAATSIVLGGSVAEGFVRASFALAGLATALVFWRLARRLLGRNAALAALALWSIEGMHLGENRWVQAQSIILLSGSCALFCFVRAARCADNLRRRWQLAGAFCFASGLFTHYDGAFIAPVLGGLWLWMERDALRARRTSLMAGALAGCIALVAAPFYIGLAQHTTAESLDRYAGLRIGNGPFNMMPEFFMRMAVLDSPAWLIAVSTGLLLAGIFVGRRLWRRSRWGGASWFVLLAVAASATLSPTLLTIGGVNLSFVPFGGLLLLLALLPAAGFRVRLLGLWVLCTWMPPAFGMALPDDHFYSSMAALTLLAAWSLTLAVRAATRRFSWPLVRTAIGTVTALVMASGVVYVYAMLVSTRPEYAMLYPDVRPKPLALFTSEPPPLLYGAYPHQSGWRVIATLYDRGILHGEYESNEMPAISNWYLSVAWRPPKAQPRYYFQVLRPFAPILASDVPLDLVQTHQLIGEIRVAGESRMVIYQRSDGGAPPLQRIWDAETLNDDWQRLASLTRFAAYRDGGRDDTAFYAVARQLAAEGREGDVVVLDGPLGRSLLARFYAGDLPLLTTLNDPLAKMAQRVWGVYWASPDRAVEREVVESTCPATARWYQNVRLSLNGVSGYGKPMPVGAELGDVARLLSASLGDKLVPGSIFCMRIAWEILGSTDGSYKLFVHFIDESGKVAAQADTQPLAGLKPSDQWRAGDQFADQVGILLPNDLKPGKYRILAGLYSEKGGTRLPALNVDGKRYTDDAIMLGKIALP